MHPSAKIIVHRLGSPPVRLRRRFQFRSLLRWPAGLFGFAAALGAWVRMPD